MKKINCFQCEECNEIYETQDECFSCENSHVGMDKLNVIHAKHEYDASRYGFPEMMLVEITDYSGVLAEYQKVREGSIEEFEEYYKAIDSND